MNQVQIMSVATGFDPTDGAIEYGRTYAPTEVAAAPRSMPSGWWLVPGAVLGLGVWTALIAGVLALLH